jgi:putative oxygen-independent coproporphyrinogen III oxidase
VTAGDRFGVYVHVPFCTRRCDYCAFATWTDRAHLMPAYADACRDEIGGAVAGGMPAATSVFFGGGTPSLLPAPLLTAVLSAIPRRPGAEVTVECNPENVTPELLAEYRRGGVTRLSFGVQSMVPEVLTSLGRAHDAGGVRRAVAAAGGAGFASAYSIDLIYGAAGEHPDAWRRTVEAALALDPPPAHVSAYGLTVEAGTPLAADVARHPDPDDQADKYAVVDDLLGAAGLEWYELSNWARPGAECRHNQLYWQQGEYRGFGCAAHSHALTADGGSRRWWNVRTPDRYIRLVGEGTSPEAAGETLDAGEREREARLLALRTRSGLALDELSPEADLDGVEGAGLVVVGAGRVTLTRRGRLLANEVTLRLTG